MHGEGFRYRGWERPNILERDGFTSVQKGGGGQDVSFADRAFDLEGSWRSSSFLNVGIGRSHRGSLSCPDLDLLSFSKMAARCVDPAVDMLGE